MAPVLTVCGREELPALVSVLDAQFIAARGRSISLAVRYPHLFVPDQLAHVHTLREGQAMLACAIARPFTWLVAERAWRAVMIGMVYTAPAVRGQGHASRLLADLLESLRSADFDLAVLWSGIEGFYERIGWRRADPGVVGRVTRAPVAYVDAPLAITPPHTPLPAEALAGADAIRNLSGSPLVARSARAWQALPLPVTQCHLTTNGHAYALTGQRGAHTYLYEMIGRTTDFRDLWQHCAERTSSISINAQLHSASYRWLSSHTAVTWQPQRLTFWYPLSAPSQRLALNACYIPYFDRI